MVMQLFNPWAIAVDSKGNIYVADAGNTYTGEGRFVRVFGSRGSDPGQLNFPADIYIDGTDTMYVTEYANYQYSQLMDNLSFGHEELHADTLWHNNGFVIVCDSKGYLCTCVY